MKLHSIYFFILKKFVKGYGFVVAANPIKMKIVDIHICVTASVKCVFPQQPVANFQSPALERTLQSRPHISSAWHLF